MTPTYPKREYFLRIAYFVLGTAICAFGCAAFVLSEIGTDPFSMLMQGVARTARITNGTAHIAINLTLLVIYLFVDRKYIRTGTFAALIITGPIIDLATFLLRGVVRGSYFFPIRVGIMLFACVMISFGLSMVINASVGVGANDLMSVIISDKLHIQFRWVRICVDAACVVSGYLLGGTIGVGTVMSALLTGPLTQFFMPRTAKALFSLLRRLAPAAGPA